MAQGAALSVSRLYPDRPILASSVAVFRDGKVLLGARANPPAAHVFSLPGGVVESGEPLEEAALRELLEETGVRARIIGFAGHTQVIEKDEQGKVRRHFVVASFAAHWISGEGTPSAEAPELLWVDPQHLGDLPVTPNLANILAQAVKLAAPLAR
jgi:ADP-ribose pyrophosphatase YjhB (NUDIX family)